PEGSRGGRDHTVRKRRARVRRPRGPAWLATRRRAAPAGPGRGRGPARGGRLVAVKFRDYYEVLGVPRTATADDIKRAYRQLARKHHPDLQPAAERTRAAERFKEINEAYEVLSDSDKRGKYDALGANWKSGMDFTPPGAEAGYTGTAGGENAENVSDFFASLFGGGAGRPGRGGVRVTIPGNDIEAELPVTLEELLHNARRRITLDGNRSLEVEIPRGSREGTVLRLAGQGERGVTGGRPGA